MNLSKNSIKYIFKKAGAEKVSDKAQIKMKKIIEEYADEIAKKAVKNSRYMGRKIIKEEDI